MSILGFFEHTISNAKRAYAYCLDAQRPRYKSIKTELNEAKAMLEVAMRYDEISKSDGLRLMRELDDWMIKFINLPQIRKKGLRKCTNS